MKTQTLTFTATIKQPGNINAAYVEFPYNTEQLFGKKGMVKIKARFDDQVNYRDSLAKMQGDCQILGLTQAVRKQLNKTFGDEVKVELWEDKEERIVTIADDVKALFAQHKDAHALYEKMSYTHRKEYMRWIEEAKKPETRERRKEKMIEMILAGKKGI